MKLEMKTLKLKSLRMTRLSMVLSLLLVDSLTLAEVLDLISQQDGPILVIILLSVFVCGSAVLLFKTAKASFLLKDMLMALLILIIVVLHAELNVVVGLGAQIKWIEQFGHWKTIVLPLIYWLLTNNFNCFKTSAYNILRLCGLGYLIFRKSYTRDTWKYELSNSCLAFFIVLSLMGILNFNHLDSSLDDKPSLPPSESTNTSLTETNLFKDLEEGIQTEAKYLQPPKVKKSKENAMESNLVPLRNIPIKVGGFGSYKGILKHNGVESKSGSSKGVPSVQRHQVTHFQDKLKVFAPILKATNNKVEYQARVELTEENRVKLLKCRESLSLDRGIKKTMEFLPRMIDGILLKNVEEKGRKGSSEHASVSGNKMTNYTHIAYHEELHIDLFHTRRGQLIDVLKDLAQNYRSKQERPGSKHFLPLDEVQDKKVWNNSKTEISDKRKQARNYLSQKHQTDRMVSEKSIEIKEQEMSKERCMAQVDTKMCMPQDLLEAIDKDPSIDSAPTEILLSILQVESRIFEISFSFETESKKAKKFNRLLGLLTHEMRSPLVAVSSFIKVYKSMLERCETVRQARELADKYLDRSVYQIDCQLDACHLILDFTKNGANAKLNVSEFNLRRMIEETCKMFADTNQAKKDVIIKYEYHEKVPEFIKSDPVRIRQVLINLLSNGLKYTLAGSVSMIVEMECFEVWKISVRDTGVGIKQEDMKNLFKEFGRINKKNDKILNANGVGLGLNLSNQLAFKVSPPDASQGIEVESEYGKGSTFSFRVHNKFSSQAEHMLFMITGTNLKKVQTEIQAIRNGSQDLSDRGNQQHSDRIEDLCVSLHDSIMIGSSLKVLVVDDSDFNLEVAATFLESLLVTYKLCSNPLQALEEIKEKLATPCKSCKVFDFIIVDFEMPFMNGDELTRQIQLMEEYKGIPIICATAQEFSKGDVPIIFTEIIIKPLSFLRMQQLVTKYGKPRALPCTCIQPLLETVPLKAVSNSDRSIRQHPPLESDPPRREAPGKGPVLPERRPVDPATHECTPQAQSLLKYTRDLRLKNPLKENSLKRLQL
jgi:signal transduction histidine kinase